MITCDRCGIKTVSKLMYTMMPEYGGQDICMNCWNGIDDVSKPFIDRISLIRNEQKQAIIEYLKSPEQVKKVIKKSFFEKIGLI